MRVELGRCCVRMHHGTVLGRQTLSSWLLRGEGTGLLKGFFFHLPSLPSLTPYSTLLWKTSSFAPVWVPADDDFDARFSSNCQFFRRNRRMSRIVLRGNATSGAQRNHNDNGIEKINTCSALFGGFLRRIARLTLSRLIEMRLRSSLYYLMGLVYLPKRLSVPYAGCCVSTLTCRSWKYTFNSKTLEL